MALDPVEVTETTRDLPIHDDVDAVVTLEVHRLNDDDPNIVDRITRYTGRLTSWAYKTRLELAPDSAEVVEVPDTLVALLGGSPVNVDLDDNRIRLVVHKGVDW